MRTERACLEMINNFMAFKRIAMVGVSRDPKNFSMMLFKELCQSGYDVVPVNPHVSILQGKSCFARMQDIHPPVEGALLMTTPDVTDVVVRDCADAGIGCVWMYGAGGKGAVSKEAIAFCHDHGMRVISGECPFMFLPHAASFHHFHGFLRKITGRYPRRAAA